MAGHDIHLERRGEIILLVVPNCERACGVLIIEIYSRIIPVVCPPGGIAPPSRVELRNFTGCSQDDTGMIQIIVRCQI
jgi:hypothetical protein